MNKKKLLPKAMEVLVFAWMGLTLAFCKKPPIPEPQPLPTPTDTVPEVPTDTVPNVVPDVPEIPNDTISGDTITPGGDTTQYSGKTVKFIYSGGLNIVPLDTIRNHLARGDSIVLVWGVVNSDNWTPVGFYGCKDSLDKRFDLCPPRIGGDGLMMVYQILPDCDSMAINKKGISQNVATWYSNKGYNVYPVVTGGKSQNDIKANNRKVRQPSYNGGRVVRAARSR